MEDLSEKLIGPREKLTALGSEVKTLRKEIWGHSNKILC